MRLPLLVSTLLLFLAPSSLASTPNELGDRRAPHDMTAGGLLLQASDGLREAPTLSTDVDIRITGLIARTRVTQRFGNPTSDWVEGIYVFPLPEDAAVDSLKMKVGTRIIEGHVEERARAKATYKRAKSEGRKAALVEQERPNLFTTSIANLGPAEEVEVILTYQEEIRYDQGRFSMRFPMVVAPRYIPGTVAVAGFSGTGWATNTNEVPDAARITPPVTAPAAATDSFTSSPSAGRTSPVTLEVMIDAGFPLDEIESASHSVRVRAEPQDRYAVRLSKGSVPADSDFVLNWRPVVGSTPSAALFRESWEDEDYALLMIVPPAPESATNARLSRETIIVIDTSGSMGGESIVQARQAVEHALGTLRPEDAFNVIRFSSDLSSLYRQSEPATPEAIRHARDWVDRLQADGGTEMLPALEAALTPSRESHAVRQVIFITDGAVGNEAALFSSIQENLAETRLYPVGIGSAPNAHFMTKAAEYGRGTFTYIGRPEEVAEKMGELFSKLDSPVLHDLQVEWGTGDVEVWPARLPDVYVGEPVVIAARLPKTTQARNGSKQIVLTGRRGNEDVRIELPLTGGSKHEGIARLWARRKVASLMNSLHDGESVDRVSVEVARLGVRHQIVTRWTSLVAVDVTPTAPPEVELDTRAVPSLLPRGWDFLEVFGFGRASGATQLDAVPQPSGSSPPAARDALHRLMPASISIGQRTASAQVGSLPQGGTPAALLVSMGSLLLGGAGLAWRRARGVAGRSSSSAAGALTCMGER